MVTTTERGYGAKHQALKAQWQQRINQAPVRCACTGQCQRHNDQCAIIIDSHTPWDLGHTADRTGYLGPQCVACNRTEGARRGRAAQTHPMIIREW